MIEDIAAILEACIAATKAVLDRSEKLTKERQQLAMLTAQFCFIGIAETGAKLLELSGPRPLETLKRMSVDELREFHALVQRYISIQLARLKKLHALLQDQQVVELFDPKLRQQIEQAVGGKSAGLYSIGAGLLFYTVFNTNPNGESTEPKELERSADIICCMYPEVKAGFIAIPQATEALARLQATALRYGEIVRKIIPGEQIHSLSKQAAELASVEAEGA